LNALEAVPLTRTGWQANMNIGLEKRGERTVLADLTHSGPLRVQRPFYPEGDTCHIYLLHPPGGVVGGDGIHLNVESRQQGHGLITTPGATKFYLSAGSTAEVNQVLHIGASSALEWFPQENIFFTGSKVRMDTLVDLDDDAIFMGWEISCFGRPVNNERFLRGRVDAKFAVRRNGVPLLTDFLRVHDASHLSAAAGMRDYPMQGLFIATGASEHLLEQSREILEQAMNKLPEKIPAGITLLDDLLVLRVLGHSTEKIQSLMIPVWQMLRREILNKDAVIPRIWNT